MLMTIDAHLSRLHAIAASIERMTSEQLELDRRKELRQTEYNRLYGKIIDAQSKGVEQFDDEL